MARDTRSLTERMRGLFDRAVTDAGTRFKQSFLDDLAGLEAALKRVGGAAWNAAKSVPLLTARLLRGHESRMATVIGIPQRDGTFKGGALRYDAASGTFEIIPGSKPFAAIAKPYFAAGKQDKLALWMIVTRAKRLMAEGRENNVPQEIIDKYENLDQENPEFREFAREWRTLNRHTLDLAQDTGLVSAESRELFEHDDYAPFYRELVDQLSAGPSGGRGQHIRSGIRELKGGEEKIANLFENMVTNISSLIERGAANAARREIYREFQGTSLLTEKTGWKPPNAKPDPSVFSFMDDGKPRYFDVEDPLLLRSMVAMGPRETSAIVQALGFPKRVLSNSITADPAYMLANVLRDSIHSAVVVGGFVPGPSTIKGFTDSLRHSPSALALMAGGASSLNFYSTAPASVRAMLETQSFKDSVIDSPLKIWRALQRVGFASEQANRIPIYEQALKNGATKMEALAKSQGVLNFTMRGDHAAMLFFIETVPFLNARIQGLARLYQGAKDNPVGFLMRGSLFTAAVVALWAANHDDERYKALSDFERQNYLHFFLGDGSEVWHHLRLPSPFEVGTIFGAIPEMFLNYWDNGRTKELTSAFATAIMNQLNLNPVPQIAKPIFDLYANKDSFTGQPIISEAEENLVPELRYGRSASSTMVAIAGSMGVSPDQAQHLLRGYGGTMAAYLLAASDALSEATGLTKPRATRRVDQMPMIQRFVREEPAMSTRWLNEFYELKTEADQIVASLKKYQKMGDVESAKALMADPTNMAKIGIQQGAGQIGRKLSDLRGAMVQVESSKTMSPDEKRQRLDALTVARNKLAESVRPMIQRVEGLTARP